MIQKLSSQNQNYNKITTQEFLRLIGHNNATQNNEFLNAIQIKNSLNT